jgi:hypothetical protein
MPNFIRNRPWIFYDFFIVFFLASLLYDIANESVTGFTWGWGLCLVYYTYRRSVFKKEMELLMEDQKND